MKNSCIILIALLLAACTSGEQNNGETTNNESADTAANSEAIDLNRYTQFLISTDGKITDSFPSSNNWLKYITLNEKQSFPNGLGAYQQILRDSFLFGCTYKALRCDDFFVDEKNDSFYCKKEVPILLSFKPTEGKSYFTEKNISNYYFFLTMLDTNVFYMPDANYGLLSFMRLKTVKQNLSFKVKNGKEEYVNNCNYEEVIWENKIPVYLFHETGKLQTYFNRWKELWECGQKSDYAPDYGFTNIQPVKGIYHKVSEENEFEERMNNPYMVLGYVVLDEAKNDLNEVKALPKSMQLVSVNGKVTKGFGVDLNNDKHADVFWCHQISELGPSFFERYTVLYLKLYKDWIPVYALVYNEFTGYGSY